jgi:hypothetical protein
MPSRREDPAMPERAGATLQGFNQHYQKLEMNPKKSIKVDFGCSGEGKWKSWSCF